MTFNFYKIYKKEIKALSVLSLLGILASCQPDSIHGITPSPDGVHDMPIYDSGPPSDADATIYSNDAICATQSKEVGLLPLDMLIVLDTSYSMDFNSKWPSIKKAIKTFVSNQQFAGLGVGIQYFPLRKQCNADEYSLPAVPIAALPGVGPAISSSLDEQQMSGGTPMVPMLEGITTYARNWATVNPQRKIVIVMATDGIPDDTCLSPPSGGLSNTLINVVALAYDAATGSPAISTFVIGVGSELVALNQISQAGGTVSAILVDTTKNIESAFLAALGTVRRQALPCDYEIPQPETGVLDYNQVNVTFTSEGKTETFVKVSDESSCHLSPTNSWYYDDPNAPKSIILCDDTCDRVQSTSEAELAFEFGCKTIVL